METIITVFQLQLTLLILIAIGACGRKVGIITQGFSDGLSAFLMKIILPCSIFSSFLADTNHNILRQSAQILLITIVIHAFYILLNNLLYRDTLSEHQSTLRFAVLCPNTNFMGMPVIGSIYSLDGILLLSIALLPARVFIMTVGISYFLTGNSATRLKGLIRNPSIWAVILGLPAILLQWHPWEPVAKTLSYLSACNTPLAMILIGTVVASLNRKMLINPEVWRFCCLRLILIPLVVMLCLRIVGIEGTVAGVSVMMSSLPAGAMTVIFSKVYGKDGDFAASCVIVSTLVSIVTIPLINVIFSFISAL